MFSPSTGAPFAKGICDLPCPGNPMEICGGNAAALRLARRQISILLSVFTQIVPGTNVVLTPSFLSSTVTTTQSPSSTISVIARTTSGPTEEAILLPTGGLILNSGVTIDAGVILGAGEIFTTIISSLCPYSILLPFLQVSTAFQTNKILAAMYIGVCGCPAGTALLSYSSTLVLTACGCTTTPSPTVSMVLTTTLCSNCGSGGVPAFITITAPYDAGTTIVTGINSIGAANPAPPKPVDTVAAGQTQVSGATSTGVAPVAISATAVQNTGSGIKAVEIARWLITAILAVFHMGTFL